MNLKALILESVNTPHINTSSILRTFEVNCDDGMIDTEALNNALLQNKLTLTDEVATALIGRHDSVLTKAVKELQSKR